MLPFCLLSLRFSVSKRRRCGACCCVCSATENADINGARVNFSNIEEAAGDREENIIRTISLRGKRGIAIRDVEDANFHVNLPFRSSFKTY